MSLFLDISAQGRLFNSAEDVQHIINELDALPASLEFIKLSGNSFGVGACIALAAAISRKKSIQECHFSDIFTGRTSSEIPSSVKALADALIKVDVHLLDLSDNAFGPAGATPLFRFLSETRSLRSLILNNNGLGISGGRCIAAALIEQSQRNDSENRYSPLVKFSAGRNRLEDGSMELLGDAFAAHCGLESISLPQNGINAQGIATLMSKISKNKHISTLDLQDNTLTRKGSRAVAETLRFWPALSILNLSDCLLGKSGSSRVFKALLRHSVSSISCLLISYNEIDNSSCNILAEWIDKFGANLVKLELNGNSFDAQGSHIASIRKSLARFNHSDAIDPLDDMVSDSQDSEASLESSDWECISEELDDLSSALKNLSV